MDFCFPKCKRTRMFLNPVGQLERRNCDPISNQPGEQNVKMLPSKEQPNNLFYRKIINVFSFTLICTNKFKPNITRRQVKHE